MTQKVSLKKAVEIARFLADEDKSIIPQPTQPPLATMMPKTAGSALDVIKNSGAKTFPQQIAALAYYVTQRNKSEHFDPKEVQILLRRMGNAPQNFGRDLVKATDVLGYISKEGPGQYIVTDTGKESITNGFQGTSKVKSRKRRIKINKSEKE